MSETRRHAVNFLEKEIKTYKALCLFFSKTGAKGPAVGDDDILISPTYYKDRIKEAKRLVSELKKSN